MTAMFSRKNEPSDLIYIFYLESANGKRLGKKVIEEWVVRTGTSVLGLSFRGLCCRKLKKMEETGVKRAIFVAAEGLTPEAKLVR